MLTMDDLVKEAERLSRPGALLVANGNGDPVAYWHGVSWGSPCITVRRPEAWISAVPDESGSCAIWSSPRAPDSGRPLYAEAFVSLPPPDALFKFGSEAVGSYLAENGWDRDWPLNSNFRDKAAHEYERHWQANCPLYSDAVVAWSGGWHFPWPEDDFLELAPHELVVCTVFESEPWIELFATGDGYLSRQRVT